MKETLWLSDDLRYSERILKTLSTFLNDQIISFTLNQENLHSQKLLPYGSVFLHINNPKDSSYCLDVLTEYLEAKPDRQRVIILLPIGYYDNEVDKDIQCFISTVIMYDNVIVVPHSLIQDDVLLIEGYEENNEHPHNLNIQPITFSYLSTLLSITLNDDFEHVVLHAVGTKTYSKTVKRRLPLFGKSVTQTSLETLFSTKRKYESGIIEKIIQDNAIEKKTPRPQPTEV